MVGIKKGEGRKWRQDWIAGCERARPRTGRARSVRAAIVRKWRGSNNSQRYLHRASMRWIAFSRRGSRNCSRPNPLKTLPSYFPPPSISFLAWSSRGRKEEAEIRRDDQTACGRLDISSRKLPGRGETRRGLENVLHRGDGNSCGLFPRDVCRDRTKRRRKGRNERWIEILNFY